MAGGRPLSWPCGFHSLTGLPCLFCGGTRAARALGHGDWHRAADLNVLAFAALPLALAAIATLATESLSGRRIVRWESCLQPCRPLVPLVLALGLLFWLAHVFLALSRPKPELVDLRNPVAAHLRILIAGKTDPTAPPHRSVDTPPPTPPARKIPSHPAPAPSR